MISDIDIYKQAYADGYNAGHEQATHRAESRQALGLPLVATAKDDEWLDWLRMVGLTIDEQADRPLD